VSRDRNNRITGDADLDTYADLMIEMREECEAEGLNFRKEMAGLARAWMRGKDAPAMPTVPNPPPNTRKETDVRQSIVKVPAPPAPPQTVIVPPALSVEARPGVSPNRRMAELFALREQLDAEIGRTVAAMGIPVAAIAASAGPTDVAAADPEPGTADDPDDEEPTPPAKRRYVRRKAAAAKARGAGDDDASPAMTGAPKRGAPCLVCVEQPDRLLTHRQAKEMAGLGENVALANYIRKGTRAGGKYTLRHATAAELAAGRPMATAPPSAAAADPDDAGEARRRAAGRTTYECLGCFTQVTTSRQPSKCARCDGRRFRVAPGPAVGAA
jgi:hypothetical protein